jgi:alkylated DNA repair dioxygenase AlkB
MDEARSTIESTVNQLLSNDPEILVRAQRDPQSNPITRYDQEWHGPWRANVAASNCYRGSKENVGWHADQVEFTDHLQSITTVPS